MRLRKRGRQCLLNLRPDQRLEMLKIPDWFPVLLPRWLEPGLLSTSPGGPTPTTAANSCCQSTNRGGRVGASVGGPTSSPHLARGGCRRLGGGRSAMLGAARLRARDTRHDGDVWTHTAGEGVKKNTGNDDDAGTTNKRFKTQEKTQLKNSATAATSLLALISTWRYLA